MIEEIEINEIRKTEHGISVNCKNSSSESGQTFRFVLRPNGKHTLECHEKGKNFTLRLYNGHIKIMKELIEMYGEDGEY